MHQSVAYIRYDLFWPSTQVGIRLENTTTEDETAQKDIILRHKFYDVAVDMIKLDSRVP